MDRRSIRDRQARYGDTLTKAETVEHYTEQAERLESSFPETVDGVARYTVNLTGSQVQLLRSLVEHESQPTMRRKWRHSEKAMHLGMLRRLYTLLCEADS